MSVDTTKETPPHKQRTLGPVPDLERHLPADWWRHLFNSVYLKTDGDVVENQHNTEREIDLAIRVAVLEPNDRILDLCCGQGRHVLALGRRGFRHVHGLDRSRYLIRLARRRAAAEKLDAKFHEGDARKFRSTIGPLHAVLVMGNSFGYFDQEEDDGAVLRAVLRNLTPGGILVLDLADGDWVRKNYQPRSWEWVDQNHMVCRERSLSSDGGRLISREVVIHAEKGVIVDQFYAERLYARPQILELLDRHGFVQVREHDGVETASTRAQDLGMMAQRLFVSAQAPRKTAAIPFSRVPFPRVTVLLGDPRMPDSVKRNGMFNEEDLDTIRRLKEALSELDRYEFTFLDDHARLSHALRTERPEFVLNLCDEGYRNNARHELHVPSLLEMLDIPFSGAGPLCLGLCYDKTLVRAIAQALDVPVPLESFCGPDDTSATLPSSFPALVKPSCGDSSIGITQHAVVRTTEELLRYLTWLRENVRPSGIIVQEFLSGTEYSVALVGNVGYNLQALPVLEVDYSKLDPGLAPILSYESKWHPDSPYWNKISYREAALDSDAVRRLQDYSTLLFERLECRDYARFDFRTDAEGTIKLLEVNPNPGWCWDGKLNLMAGMAGWRYSDLLRSILEAAQERLALAKSNLRVAAVPAVPVPASVPG